MNPSPFVMLILLATSLPAAPPPQPWQWSTSDRLAARAARMAERHAGPSSEIEFHGATEPEVFLPFEAYDDLLRRAFEAPPEERRRNRLLFEQRTAKWRPARGQALWPTLQRHAATLLASRRAQREAARGLDGAAPPERQRILQRIAELQRGECASRAAALARSRQAFGAELFDRFLYVAVVPDMFIRVTADDATPLQFIQGGCS